MSKINSVSFSYMRADFTDVTSVSNYIVNDSPYTIDLNVTIDKPSVLNRYPISELILMLYVGDKPEPITQYRTEGTGMPTTFPYTGILSFRPEDYSAFSKSSLSFSLDYVVRNSVNETSTGSCGSITRNGVNRVRYYNAEEEQFKDGILRVYNNGTWSQSKIKNL